MFLRFFSLLIQIYFLSKVPNQSDIGNGIDDLSANDHGDDRIAPVDVSIHNKMRASNKTAQQNVGGNNGSPKEKKSKKVKNMERKSIITFRTDPKANKVEPSFHSSLKRPSATQ